MCQARWLPLLQLNNWVNTGTLPALKQEILIVQNKPLPTCGRTTVRLYLPINLYLFRTRSWQNVPQGKNGVTQVVLFGITVRQGCQSFRFVECACMIN